MDEETIERKLMKNLWDYGWFCKKLHGNAYQSGLPDLLVARSDRFQGFIEVKRPVQFSFENSQLITFPQMDAAGCQIYVLDGFSDEHISLLARKPNWRQVFEAYHLNLRVHVLQLPKLDKRS